MKIISLFLTLFLSVLSYAQTPTFTWNESQSPIENELNYTIDGYLRYEFNVGIAYENNPTKAIKIINETIQNIEGVLKDDKEPAITIDELSTNAININVKFWIDTFNSNKRSVHNSIRSRVMNNILEALIANGFSLPASIVELKNYEPYGDLKINVEQNMEKN